jgi:uracil-DNA glycosylase family 4
MGFFSESVLLKDKRSERAEPACHLCGLYKTCNSPKMEPAGKGKARVLIVGEAPGRNEDDKGEPFVGSAGQYQEKILKRLNIRMRKDCWLTNSNICRPPGNETPTDEQIGYCHPNLVKTIDRLDPDVIVTVGRTALQSMLQGIWLDPIGALNRWVGWKIPLQSMNRWLIPTYHPTYVQRELKSQKRGTAIEKVFQRHLKQINEIEGKPYKAPVDWSKDIEVIKDDVDASKLLVRWARKGDPIAFDFETNMLKPDKKFGKSDDSKLVSASVCWRGRRTISFPWYGKIIPAFKWLMESDCPKIAHNFKFEDRWVDVQVGTTVRNWAWDTMNQAHIIDNRKEIVSLGFQAMVNFGVGTWGYHIGPFLEQKRSYSVSRIKEIDIDDLLIYGGMDSLTCYKLMELQRKILRMEPL